MIFWVPDQGEILFPRQMSYQEKVLADTVLLLPVWILRCAFLATPQLLPGAEYQKFRTGLNSDSPSSSLSEPIAGKWWRGISRWYRRNSRDFIRSQLFSIRSWSQTINPIVAKLKHRAPPARRYL